MDGLFLIFVLIAIVNVFTGSRKKKQQEEAKRRAAQQAQMQQQAPPADPRVSDYNAPPAARPVKVDPRFPDMQGGYAQAAARPAADPRFPDYDPPQESAARRERQREVERELAEVKRAAEARLRQRRQEQARTQPQQKQPAASRVAPSAYTPIESRLEAPLGRQHTLEASFVSGHAHTESSLTGIQEECPPGMAPASHKRDIPIAKAKAAARNNTLTGDALGRLVQDRDALVTGVLMAEVLGKPKALRHG